MNQRLTAGGHRRFVILPDLFSDPAHHAAAAAFTTYVAANPPDAVVIVVASGVDPVVAATAIEALRAEYHGTVTLLYGGMMHSQLHRHGGWPANPTGLAAGPLPIAHGWRVVALNPSGNCRYAGAQAIRLARVLGCNVICAGGAIPSKLSITHHLGKTADRIWAIELGRLPTTPAQQRSVSAAFAVIETGAQAADPALITINTDGSLGQHAFTHALRVPDPPAAA